MMSLINTWQFNIILYLIAITGFAQFYKLAVKNAKNDGAATIMLQIIAGISVLFIAPFLLFKFPANPKMYILLGVACIFYALNDRLQTTARKHLDVSLVSIINQFLTVLLVIYGIIIFKNPIVPTKLLGVLIIVGANILLFMKGTKLQLNKHVVIFFLAILALATALSIDIGISEQFNLPIYNSITFLLPAIFISAGERIPLKSAFAELKTSTKKYYFITGILWALAIFFYLRSFQFGEVSTIVSVAATNVIFSVVAAYIFLNEREDRLKKLIAAILVVIGVYLTVI